MKNCSLLSQIVSYPSLFYLFSRVKEYCANKLFNINHLNFQFEITITYTNYKDNWIFSLPSRFFPRNTPQKSPSRPRSTGGARHFPARKPVKASPPPLCLEIPHTRTHTHTAERRHGWLVPGEDRNAPGPWRHSIGKSLIRPRIVASSWRPHNTLFVRSFHRERGNRGRGERGRRRRRRRWLVFFARLCGL